MAGKDRRPAVTPKADNGGRFEDGIRNARDSLPGMRDPLPKGALGGVPTDSQGDEIANRRRARQRHRHGSGWQARAGALSRPHARLSRQATQCAPGGSVAGIIPPRMLRCFSKHLPLTAEILTPNQGDRRACSREAKLIS
jgi:hypothetical protein